MNLYRILIPTLANDGTSHDAACKLFEADCLRLVGGFTRNAKSCGAWVDDGGAEKDDETIPYDIACSYEQWPEILGFAFQRFSDQLAIFWTQLGEARIEKRIDSKSWRPLRKVAA